MQDPYFSYGLSQEAEKDLEEIFDYSLLKFGRDQAISYCNTIVEQIEYLVQNPKIGKERNDIKAGLFSILCGKHILFYRILPNRIWIVRLLHGHRDIPSSFMY